MTSGRERASLPETEVGFQQAVVELASLRGWLCYHTHDSRRSQAGFPDLTMVRGPRLVFAELKSEKGRTSPAQRLWLDQLAAVAEEGRSLASEWNGEHEGTSYYTERRSPVEVYEWRPRDWTSIEATLL